MWPDALRLLPLAPGVSRSFRGVPPLPAAGVEVVEPTEGEGDGGARARLVPPVSLEAAADMLLAKAACCLSNEFIVCRCPEFTQRIRFFCSSLSLSRVAVAAAIGRSYSVDTNQLLQRTERFFGNARSAGRWLRRVESQMSPDRGADD